MATCLLLPHTPLAIRRITLFGIIADNKKDFQTETDTANYTSILQQGHKADKTSLPLLLQ